MIILYLNLLPVNISISFVQKHYRIKTLLRFSLTSKYTLNTCTVPFQLFPMALDVNCVYNYKLFSDFFLFGY